MAHTYEDLKNKRVADLRDVAKDLEHEALEGYTQMHKDELVLALCNALGIEDHAHHEVVGINKRGLKAEIKKLKAERAAALEAKDRKQHKAVIRQIHRLKHKLRRATV